MDGAVPSWVFGYGSLIWKQDFDFIDARPAWIQGWGRRFWQGSHDHRGVPHDPGRVVTLVREPGRTCHGRAFLVEARIFEHLDFREKNGYRQMPVEIFFSGGSARGVTYLAPQDNFAWLGPASMAEIAQQVLRCCGPSGANRDYVLMLARELRQLGIHDDHVFELESLVLKAGHG